MEKGYYFHFPFVPPPRSLSQSTIKMEKGYYQKVFLYFKSFAGRNPQ